MPKKSGLTKEEHFALGAALTRARDDVTTSIVKVSAAYSVNGKEVRALRKAAKALDEARSVMDSAICAEVPDDDAVRAYYPQRSSLTDALKWPS